MDIALLTSNVTTTQTPSGMIVTGDGVFDKLMSTVTTHLQAQYLDGRITGTEYATTYLGVFQATVAQSVAFLLSAAKADAEVSLLKQKEVTEFAQTLQSDKVAPDLESAMGKQILLYDKQAKGFVWNAQNSKLKTLSNMWSVNISTAGVAATNITGINAVGEGNLNEYIAGFNPE